jgi:hypothetical protein
MSELTRSQGRYFPATGPIGSAQLNDRRDLVFAMGPKLDNALHDLDLRRAQIIGRGKRLYQGLQPVIELVEAGEEMQDAFVDPERSGHEPFVVGQLDQPPAAQG